MFLINWLESYIMIAVTILILIGIPVFIFIMVFSQGKKSKDNSSEQV